MDFERDGKIYTLGHAQSRIVEKSLRSEDKEVLRQTEKIIRKNAIKIVDKDGTVEREFKEPKVTVSRGFASTGDAV